MKLNTLYLNVNPSTMLYVGTSSLINTWGGNGQGANLAGNLTAGGTAFGLVLMQFFWQLVESRLEYLPGNTIYSTRR